MGIKPKDGVWVTASMEETAAKAGGLCRFGVSPETAPHSWQAFRRLARADQAILDGLVAGARRHGADPSRWYVSFVPVPRDKWLAIETWYRGKWDRISLDYELPDDLLAPASQIIR
jgi:hypothetical protein